MLNLAFRNIFRQRTRTALTLAAIALGVASLVLSGGFVADMLFQLREATIRSQLGHLQVYKHGRFASGGQQPFDYLIENPQVVERAIEGLEDTVTHARRLSLSGLITNGRGELPFRGEGIEPTPEAQIGAAMNMISGRQLSDMDRFGIMLGEGLANAMKLKVGDRVDLVLSTPAGAMNTLDFSVVGVFRTLSKEYDAYAIRIPLAAAQELAATTAVTAVVVLLADTDLTARAQSQLLASLPSGFEVKPWHELADFYQSTVALYERQFGVLEAIIVVMVLLGVANNVNMTLHERTLEFGIMRALGHTGGHVFRVALLEVTLLGVLGAALGAGIGMALALVISAFGIPMPPPPNSESDFTAGIQVVPNIVGLAFALGCVASICAAVLPARRLARISIVDALRQAA
jgi:putative ABC transport system permease protein